MEDLKEQYDSLCKEKNVIDLTRGKPSPEQLNLSEELDGILDGNFIVILIFPSLFRLALILVDIVSIETELVFLEENVLR